MSIAIFIIGLVLVGLPLVPSLFGRLNRRKAIKTGKPFIRVPDVIRVISYVAGISLVLLSYLASIETEDQIQLTKHQASEATEKADKAQAQITEIRTPRRMEPETKRMLAAKVKPYAGQKYDMKVFRDQDSLRLATAIQAILQEADWVHTNVYPRYATHYAETSDNGVWLMSGKVETRMTSEARMALHGALNEAGLYNDSTAFTPVN